MIEKAAFIWSVNDAWAMLAGFALLGVLVVPFAWKTAKARRLGTADRENLRDQWTPAIHLDKEPAIAVHQPEAAAQLTSAIKSKARLEAENAVLRHQLIVLRPRSENITETWRLSERSSGVVSVLGTTVADGAFALSSTRRAGVEKSKISSCVMPLSAEVDEFLEVASAALPRITEIIFALPAEHRAGALKMAERRYRQAARDFGCAEADSERWVAAVMRKLRTLMEQGDSARSMSSQRRSQASEGAAGGVGVIAARKQTTTVICCGDTLKKSGNSARR